MDSVVIAEVLEKSGKVHERIKLTQFPAVLGRAYDSDLILSDDFVSAHHARIEQNATGEFLMTDLDTENGSYLLPDMRMVKTLTLGADTLLRLGHTLVRLRRPHYAVAPPNIDTLARSRFAFIFSSRLTLTVLALLMLSMLAFTAYQSSAQQIKLSKLILEILEIAALAPLWAGLWAILSRVFAHYAAYIAHAVIACLAIIGFFIVDTLVEYYAFAFSAQLSADILFDLLFGSLTFAVLYGHLRFATLLVPKRAGLIALASATALIALSSFTTYVQGLDFNDTLAYPPELKPAQFRVVAQKSLDEFIRGAEQLPRDLQRRD